MALELNLTKPSETKFFFNPIASGLRIISVSQEIWGVIIQPLRECSIITSDTSLASPPPH